MGEDLFNKARGNLKKYWDYTSFREGQDEAIRSVLDGQDTVVLFPTGGGKSICYQVPATVLEGITIVISPLVALMQDQVYQLDQRGIKATYVNSSLSLWEVEQRLVNARNGMYDLIYLAPERLKTDLWKAEAPRMDIELVAVDEAHCISEWGHDFRPTYREIRPRIEEIAEDITWMALTATATPEVQEDIITNLEFRDPKIISKGFDRPNLKWWVIQTEAKDQKLLQTVSRAEGSGLIYGGTRKNCERIADLLTVKGIPTEAYHAGLEGRVRNDIQNRWIEGSLPLVAATSAFGMGIDKEDCRYVIHYDIPNTLEAYYQQAGRAGRDGKESFPILLYKSTDYKIARKRILGSYPTRKQLQHLYDALCDMLELAVGSGMDSAKQVSIDKLSKRSDLPVRLVKAGLNVMDRMGIVQFITYIEPSIGIRFIISETYLRQLIDEPENKRKANFLDGLYRHYGGQSMGALHFLPTEYLEEKLGFGSNKIIKGLEVLAGEQVLEYEVRGGQPLIQLLEARVSKLPLRKEELEHYRNVLLEKLRWMKGYAETEHCRSYYLRTYFGEEGIPRHCDYCDNCLKDPTNPGIEVEESDLRRLKKLLKKDPRTIEELQSQTQWERKRIEKTLTYLTQEGRVTHKVEDPHRFYWVK